MMTEETVMTEEDMAVAKRLNTLLTECMDKTRLVLDGAMEKMDEASDPEDRKAAFVHEYGAAVASTCLDVLFNYSDVGRGVIVKAFLESLFRNIGIDATFVKANVDKGRGKPN